jgi:hypothetical protein
MSDEGMLAALYARLINLQERLELSRSNCGDNAGENELRLIAAMELELEVLKTAIAWLEKRDWARH